MKHPKTGIVVLLSLASILVFVTARAETMTYTDKQGRVVSIPLPVKRAAIFQTYELIPALEIWDNVVGIGRYAYTNDLMTAIKPDIESVIPSPGSGNDVNMEALFKLEPELVITWTYQPETIRFMEEKGLKVIGVAPENLAELYEVTRIHGRLFAKQAKAQACIAEMERMFALVAERVSQVPPEGRKKVLWLLGKPTTIACGQGVSSDLVRLMGGINPASAIPRTSVDTSMEQIIAWNPDLIFIWGHAGYTAESIINNSQWRFVTAVKQRRVYKAPLWSTWSPRVAPIVLWMAMKAYPEAFSDVHAEKTFDEFYRKVFGIPYERVKRIE